MPAPSLPDGVLASLPGWERATWQPISGGLTNRTFLLEQDGRRAVLKIDDAERSAPYNSRAEERRIQSLAAEAGLANRVLFATDTLILTDYVDGRVWVPDDLRHRDQLTELAAALRRLHALPATGRSFDARGAAKLYLSQLDDADREQAQAHVYRIESTPVSPTLCLCHNDLVVENMVSRDGLRFLDWEYACDNDPLFDLATIITHHGLSRDDADFLLDAYFYGEGQRWRAQLDAQCALYKSLYWLWDAAQTSAITTRRSSS